MGGIRALSTPGVSVVVRRMLNKACQCGCSDGRAGSWVGVSGTGDAGTADILVLTGTYVLVLGILKLCVEIPGSTYVLYAMVRHQQEFILRPERPGAWDARDTNHES